MCYAFSDLGHDVTLAVPDAGDNLDSIKKNINNKINKEIKFPVITYPKITIKGRFSVIGGYLGIKKMLKNRNTDIFFVRNPVIINAAIKRDIFTIFESHNVLLNKKNKILDLFWKKNLIKNCKSDKLIRFVTISHGLAEIWKLRGVPEEKIITLHDGVDADSFSVILNKHKLRKQLRLPFHKKIVLYAGSLYPDRGIEKILELAKLFPQVFFLVLGGPENRKMYYIKSSKDLNIRNILFVGYIPHYKVKDYLFAADVLLMIWTSKVKTINYCSPLKMFEYMASSRIIVGHGFPTIKEVLTDGKNAYLADPNSFEELRVKLALGLKEYFSSRMAAEARKLAIEKYSWKARAQAILHSINKNY